MLVIYGLETHNIKSPSSRGPNKEVDAFATTSMLRLSSARVGIPPPLVSLRQITTVLESAM